MINLPFINSEMQTEFTEKGYVIIPFFNESEVALLQLNYDAVAHNQGLIFESTSFLEDINVKNNCNEVVSSIFKSKIDTVFENYKPLEYKFQDKKGRFLMREMNIHYVLLLGFLIGLDFLISKMEVIDEIISLVWMLYLLVIRNYFLTFNHLKKQIYVPKVS